MTAKQKTVVIPPVETAPRTEVVNMTSTCQIRCEIGGP